MKTYTFSFLKNRYFISGLVTGIILAFIVTIVIVLPYLPLPEKDMLKGTMSGGEFEPAVGDKGKVMFATHVTNCEGQPERSHVYFDNGKGCLTICHPGDDGSFQLNTRVKVDQIISGDYCNGGGVWVTVDQ